MSDNKELNRQAGIAGLFVGLVSGGCYFITYGCSEFLTAHQWLSYIIAFGKTFACVYLLYYFMKDFYNHNSARSHFQGTAACRRFGVRTALYSGIITSFCAYAALAWCFPDYFQATIDTTVQQMSSMLDSNSLAALDEMMPKLPAYMTITTFLWCLLFGTIASSIISSRIAGKSNPFDDDSEDDII